MTAKKQFIADGSLAADFTSESIPTNIGYELHIVLTADGSGTNITGDFYFQGSIDGITWWNLPIDSVGSAVGATAATHAAFTAGDDKITLTAVASAAVILAVAFASPPPLVRVFFDRTAGAADALQGTYFMRRDA